MARKWEGNNSLPLKTIKQTALLLYFFLPKASASSGLWTTRRPTERASRPVAVMALIGRKNEKVANSNNEWQLFVHAKQYINRLLGNRRARGQLASVAGDYTSFRRLSLSSFHGNHPSVCVFARTNRNILPMLFETKIS